MQATKDAIRLKALEIINTRGLSGLSIRAVAEELGLSPGNVSYHFSRKEDLVQALSMELGARNNAVFQQEPTSPRDLLEMLRSVFHTQYGHRGLVLALPDIIETFSDVRAHYRKAERARWQRLFQLLEALRKNGALEGTDRELMRLVSQISFIARFWIGEARLSYSQFGEERVIAHYLAMIAEALRPLATPTAEQDLVPYLEGWIDLADASLQKRKTPPPRM